MSNDNVITECFSRTASQFANKMCLQIREDSRWKRYTFAQTLNISKQIASCFIQNGIGKGDFVMLILQNCPEWALFYLGIIYSGACAVPIDTQASIEEIENIAKSCKAKAVILSHKIFSEQDFTDIEPQFKMIIVEDLAIEPVKGDRITNLKEILNTRFRDNLDLPKTTPEDCASLIYTSGTTGKPKGVLLTHANFCHNIKSMRDLKMCTPDDNALCLLPLFHTYAFMGGLLAPISIGATVTFCPNFKPEDVTATIKDASITFMTAVPEFFKMLRNKIFAAYYKTPRILRPVILAITKRKFRQKLGSSLRLFVSGGARSDPQVCKDLARLGIEVNEGYGLTETSPIVTLNPSDKIKYGSAGKPLPGVEIKIIDPDETGCGEVAVKGPNVMQGYYNMPRQTDEVIKVGWFYTGDLGYLDKDGYLFITGRLRDMIVLPSGKNIYPDQLENEYLSSEFIKEICIIKNDKYPGLYAVIYPDITNFRDAGIVNIQERIKWELETISKKLPTYNRVLGFSVSKDPLPRTRIGKVKRFEVEKQFAAVERERKNRKPKYSEHDKHLIHTADSKHIIHFMQNKYKRDIHLDDSLELDLGIDSLGRIELMDNLEASLGIKIPDEVIANVFTVRELLSEIGKLKTAGTSAHITEFAWKDVLFKLPPSDTVNKLRIKPNLSDRIGAIILPAIFWCFFKLFGLFKIEGKHNLPHNGPYIICPNHNSYFDAFIVVASLPRTLVKSTFFLGYSEIIERPVFRWAMKFARLTPIDSNAKLSYSLQVSSYLLRSSKVICIFPEGKRSIDETVQPFKKGVAILAKELNVPIIPVSIEGTLKAWPRGQKFPKPARMKIKYGKPTTASQLLRLVKHPAEDRYQAIANQLREQLIKLKC